MTKANSEQLTPPADSGTPDGAALKRTSEMQRALDELAETLRELAPRGQRMREELRRVQQRAEPVRRLAAALAEVAEGQSPKLRPVLEAAQTQYAREAEELRAAKRALIERRRWVTAMMSAQRLALRDVRAEAANEEPFAAAVVSTGHAVLDQERALAQWIEACMQRWTPMVKPEYVNADLNVIEAALDVSASQPVVAAAARPTPEAPRRPAGGRP